MREQNVCTEIVNSIKACGAWAYKIDDPRVFGPNIFHRKRPFDIFALHGPVGLAIEVKLLKSYAKISRRLMQDHQIENFDTITAQGGNAFLMVNVRISDAKINRLYTFNWSRWGKIIKQTGIAKDILLTLPYCQGAKGLFNLSSLLGGLQLERK